jgi:hypothetical protein
MGVPAVNQTELDGSLGILPPSSGELLTIVGWSSAGPIATPATYGSVSSLVGDFGSGPMVEAAARHIDQTGNPVCVCRSDKTTDGAYGSITQTGTGLCVVTAHTATKPYDDYEVLINVVLGGTVGTGPVTLQWSLDGGRNFAPPVSLGVATTYLIADGNVQIDMTSATLVTGDTISFRTSAPIPNATQLGAAIDSLRTTTINIGIIEIACPIDTTLFDQIETSMAALYAILKFKAWVGSIRTPNLAESESSYLAAQSGFASKATKIGELCAGACEFVSGVSRRKYRRPPSFVLASLEATVQEHIDIAAISLGPLVGVSITDANGNPKHHNELLNPGLDDARFSTLRTWVGRQGVFPTRPRIFSSAGSDFYLMPHRRVMNLARATTHAYLELRLSKPVAVNPVTGFILEEEALEIEAGGNAALAAVLGQAPKASAWKMVLSRTDNIISTKTITVTTRITPLGYPEFISESIGYTNPALSIQST